MQRAKLFGALFAYINIQITWKTIHLSVLCRTVHLQIKAEQKKIIRNVLERKDSMAECYQRDSERACVTSPLFGQGTTTFFFLMVICNSLNLLLKSLPINIINCIKFYVNCSALTPMIGNKNICLFVYMQIISHDTLR